MKTSLSLFLLGALILMSATGFVSSDALCDKALDLNLVLDHSASIPSSQFSQIKTQSINFLNLFDDSNQRMGLVDFARQGTLVQGLTYDFFQVAVGINSMTQLGGGTNMGEGILKSTEELQNTDRGVSEYMIVISDGLPNVMTYPNGTSFDCPGTPTPLSPCVIYTLDKAQEAKDDGIVVFTIGSNINPDTFQETFMEDVASDPSKYFASPNFANLEEIYNQIGTEICTNQADLNIFDDSDSGEVFVNEDISFYANYTDLNTEDIIDTADCDIAFDLGSGFGSWNPMSYNSVSELFEYTDSFSDEGTFDFRVRCSDSAYETLISTDSFIISDNGTNNPPTVIFTVPIDGAENVSINQNIIITFSEPMDPSSINSLTFLLADSSGTISGAIVLVGSIATFVPLEELEQNTTYNVTITNEVEDLSGMNMLNDYVFSFKTGDGNSQEEGVCGNNVLENEEECDDGNTLNDDDCTNLCTFGEDSDDNDNDNDNDGNGIISFGGNGECSLQWDCTEWGLCLNGVQTKVCSINNACPNALTNKPVESQTCGKFNLQSKDKESSFWLFFWVLFIACVLLLILILVLRMLA